jgi:hypothetical protein
MGFRVRTIRDYIRRDGEVTGRDPWQVGIACEAIVAVLEYLYPTTWASVMVLREATYQPRACAQLSGLSPTAIRIKVSEKEHGGTSPSQATISLLPSLVELPPSIMLGRAPEEKRRDG